MNCESDGFAHRNGTMTLHLNTLAGRRGHLRALGALLALAGALTLAGCGTRDAAPASTFVLIDGSKATTADLKGKVTLVNFWELDNTGELAQAWGEVKLTPTSYLVDKQGQIVKRFVGEPDMAALHNLIEELLAKG